VLVNPTLAEARLIERWRPARTFVVIGSIFVVAGGLVAAVSGPTSFERGSWLAAYLVLVGGVAQIVLGAGQAWLADRVPPDRSTRFEAWSWNAGVATVVIGTLASMPVLTSLGGLASAAALWLFLAGVRTVRPASRVVALLYRGVAAIVLVSIPVGIALAWTRHG
jgi:hypothetical protein